jgi:hypothetical protein
MAGCFFLLSFHHCRSWSSVFFSSWQKVDLASFYIMAG